MKLLLFAPASCLLYSLLASTAFAASATMAAQSVVLQQSGPYEGLIISVILDGEPKGDYFAIQDRAGKILLREHDVSVLGLAPSEGTVITHESERYRIVSTLQDASATFDARSLTLTVITKAGSAAPPKKTVIDFSPPTPQKMHIFFPRETSAFLNYGISYAKRDPTGEDSFMVSNRLGGRTGDVFFLSDSQYTKTDVESRWVRLMSTATYERRSDLQLLNLGDMYATSGELGSTINIGGIGLTRTYRLDPYYLAQPAFNMSGVVSQPSQVEIYVDGRLVRKQYVAPGEFDIQNFKTLTGAQTVEVLIRDPYGNVQKVSTPFYSPDVGLQRGLHEYSYTIGVLREQFGQESNTYGDFAYSAYHRYGVTDVLNLGARIEGASGVNNGGLLAGLVLPRLGVLSAAVSASTSSDRRGSAGFIGYTYQKNRLYANVYARSYSRDYQTAGTGLYSSMLQYSRGALVSYGDIGGGTLALSYFTEDSYAGHGRATAAASYSRRLSPSWTASGTIRTIRDTATDYEALISFYYSFGKDSLITVQYRQSKEAESELFQVQKETPRGEGVGYHAIVESQQTRNDSSYVVNPFVVYKARYGTYTLDATMQNMNNTTEERYQVSAAGSLVYVGGFWGASRPVDDSFTFVVVDALKDIGVTQNSDFMGSTDATGKMIVPSMRSYGHNQVAVDAERVPLDYSLSSVGSIISPPLWSGSCISFEAKKEQAVTGRLVVQTGKERMPLEYREIVMQVGDREVRFPTGKDGEFYADNVIPRALQRDPVDPRSCQGIAADRSQGKTIPPGYYHAWVDYEGKKCTFDLIFPVTSDVMTDVGEVPCLETAPAK